MRLSLQSKSVEATLSPYLKGDDLKAAVTLWQEKYAHQSLDFLPNYVRSIVNHFNLKAHQPHLIYTLRVKLTQPIPEPIPEPAPVSPMTLTQQRILTPMYFEEIDESLSAELPTYLTAFILIMNSFFETEAGLSQLFFLALKKQALKLGFSGLDVHNIENWLNHKNTNGLILFNIHSLRLLFNIFYTLNCNRVGSTKTDLLVKKNIRSLEFKYPLLNFKSLL